MQEVYSLQLKTRQPKPLWASEADVSVQGMLSISTPESDFDDDNPLPYGHSIFVEDNAVLVIDASRLFLLLLNLRFDCRTHIDKFSALIFIVTDFSLAWVVPQFCSSMYARNCRSSRITYKISTCLPSSR